MRLPILPSRQIPLMRMAEVMVVAAEMTMIQPMILNREVQANPGPDLHNLPTTPMNRIAATAKARKILIGLCPQGLKAPKPL